MRLANGEEVRVNSVIASNLDPQHLVLDLLGEAEAGAELTAAMRRYEWGHSFFAIYAALDRPVPYAAGAEPGQAGYVHAGASVDDIAQAVLECRSGLLPATLMLGVLNEAGIDPSRAPAGKALMTFVARFVRHRVRGDATGQADGAGSGRDWRAIKDAYADYIIDWLSGTSLPGLRERMVARAVHAPADMERQIISAVHGTHQHGVFLPYQIGIMANGFPRPPRRPQETARSFEASWRRNQVLLPTLLLNVESSVGGEAS